MPSQPGKIDPIGRSNADLFGLYDRFYYGVPAPRFNPNPSINFVNTRQPSAGAGRYAYDLLALAEFTFIGAGVANQKMSYRALQPPQPRALFAIPQVGLGGLVAGTMALQPLQQNVWSEANPTI